IYISFDEWGIMSRNFLSVLPIAQCLNSFLRHADVVKMANFTMLTSLLSSDREKGTFKTPLFYLFKLYSNNCRGVSVDAFVRCERFDTEKYKGIPYLDVTATYSEESRILCINVVNRHKEKSITAELTSVSASFDGKASAYVVTAKSLEEPFSFDKQKDYLPLVQPVESKGKTLSFTFPAHSFTQIQVPLKVKA
ncbi:MAG: alpha-N-arabinofuranosidase, partial [candidate division KSB1 bacterium]|nr:alpha-N-arabinofuranosidase [candidate division KSB1 bacterium]